ncbi:MAG: hypothetical protein FJZ92_05615 [Chloroflexi bacterium]|nr:hypothetical protein [Chloroflexota bacterium]
MQVNLDFPPIVELEDDSLEAIQDFFETQGWTDGLPFIPPTRQRVREMYQHVDWAPSDVIAVLGPRNGEATLERIATNAVMAGCRPEHFPVVVTAVQAVAQEPFNLSGIQATTHPCAVLVLINGPVASELGVNSGPNCFGQGARANAAIGRAVRLALQNIGGGTPGDGDRATHGSPAKYAFCAAENEAQSPWEPLHVEHGFAPDDSVVTVLACEGPHNINDHGSIGGLGILTTVSTSLRQSGSNNIGAGRGEPMVVFGPEHAEQVARDGYSKDDVKRFLWEHTRLPVADWSPDWRTEERLAALESDTGQREFTRLTATWQDLDVIVAGGPGKHSCWLPTFGGTGTVLRRIERADGTPVRSIFRP